MRTNVNLLFYLKKPKNYKTGIMPIYYASQLTDNVQKSQLVGNGIPRVGILNQSALSALRRIPVR